MKKQHTGSVIALMVLSSCVSENEVSEVHLESRSKEQIVDHSKESEDTILKNADGIPLRTVDSSRVKVIAPPEYSQLEIQEVLSRSTCNWYLKLNKNKAEQVVAPDR